MNPTDQASKYHHQMTYADLLEITSISVKKWLTNVSVNNQFTVFPHRKGGPEEGTQKGTYLFLHCLVYMFSVHASLLCDCVTYILFHL